MKLFPKIIGIGIVGLLVAGLVTAISIVSGNMYSGTLAEEAKYQDFQNELVKARLAHLSWLRTINAAMITKSPTLTIGRDGRLCAFGEWYYSDETTKEIKGFPEKIQTIFRNIEPGHLDIHVAGGEMMDMWNKDNLPPSDELLNTCAEMLITRVNPAANALLERLVEMEDLCQVEIKRVQDGGEFILQYQSMLPLGALLIGALILIPYAWLTARGIVRPLQMGGAILQGISEKGCIQTNVPEDILRRSDELGALGRDIGQVLENYRAIAGLAGQLADGDWKATMREKSPEDILGLSLEKMLNQVNEALHKINGGVGRMATSSGEVSNAAQSLADGAQKAAASLEEITASMSEISGQTKKNAQNAAQAQNLAQQASKAATQGQEAMQEMTGAMQRITQNSNEIQRVIKVIDDIAFQTNLLALNAAVEAARAGVHGKGFAVVAEEVRNLAARSAKAAQETTDLISKSGQEIGNGGEVASRTSEVLNSIVEQIKQTAELVGGIATASNEQAEGVNQVTIGLQQIDAVTQQNTASAEESASASNEMSSMATNLQQLVGQFKLKTPSGQSVAAHGKSTPPMAPVAKPVAKPVAIAKPAAPAAKPVVKPAVVAKPKVVEKPAAPGADNWGGVKTDASSEVAIHLDDHEFGKY
jgi:methyl-accepting chemotaxis protein